MSDDEMEGETALLTHNANNAKWLILTVCMCADYGFEYSDEEVGEEDVDIENQYYNSKGRTVCCKRWV